MGDVEHLSDAHAIAKIKQIADGQIGLFCTFTGTTGPKFHTRPMATQKVDDSGTLWFLTSRSNNLSAEIATQSRVQLLYALTAKSEYLSVEGEAFLTDDRSKIDELWTPLAKTWFPNGKDDPDLTIVGVRALSGHYWDTKTNRLVQLGKMLVGAVTGNPFDDGVDGQLKV